MAEIIPEKETQEAKDAGTEFNSHMTADGAEGSHSAAFGLTSPDSGDSSSKTANNQPGDMIANEDKATSSGGSDPAPAQKEAQTGGMADGTSSNVPPGAGSTSATPSQGSGKV